MYILPKLTQIPGLCHGFSTIAHGNQSFKYGGFQEVTRNRRRFLRELKHPRARPENLVCMMPFSSSKGREIAIIYKDERGCGANSQKTALRREALITTDTNIFLFLALADCLPIILYDPVKRVLALAHCSRKMSEERLLERVIQTMKKEFGVLSHNIIAGIGPGIGKQSYLLKYFNHEYDSEWRDFCQRCSDKIAVDLYGFNATLLKQCGVINIECSDLDTVRDWALFFSHYRAEQTGEPEGRHAVVVGMI